MNKGFWSPRTATLDWCEINYEVTYYIAEFWNTISNLIFLLPLYGIYWSAKKNRQANKLEKENVRHPYKNGLTYFRLPKSIFFCHLGLLSVGVGSWMFHMTLKYPMQLLDEIPMIWGTGILIVTYYDLILQISELNRVRSRKTTHESSNFSKCVYSRLFVFILVFGFCSVVTAVYVLVWTNPIFHEVSYGFLVLIVIYQSFSLIYKLNLSKRLYVLSLFYYLFGFLLWNIDNNFCSYLKQYRGFIDELFGFNSDYSNYRAILLNVSAVCLKSIFELHSLWHLFTGYASYMTTLFLIDCTYQKHAKESKLDVAANPIVKGRFFNLYYGLNDISIVDETKKN